jgi:Flp pilus assembly protein TadD
MNAAPPAADAASAAAAPASAAERGWERYQNGDLEGARRELASAATEKGAAPWVSYALGLAESGLGHYREASVALERVRTEEPDFKPAYLDLADGYLQSGEPKKAADALRDACARWPRDTDVWNALGVALLHQRGLDAAIDAFRQAASLDPRDALALFNLGQAFEQRYLRSRRWDGTRRVSTANEDDRAAARAHYERYLAIGGPFETQARAALSSLEGVK